MSRLRRVASLLVQLVSVVIPCLVVAGLYAVSSHAEADHAKWQLLIAEFEAAVLDYRVFEDFSSCWFVHCSLVSSCLGSTRASAGCDMRCTRESLLGVTGYGSQYPH